MSPGPLQDAIVPPQNLTVPLQNATAPPQAAPPPMATLPIAPIANATMEDNPPVLELPQAEPTAAPATPAATQPTVAQAQPTTIAQVPYAQPGECKYHCSRN